METQPQWQFAGSVPENYERYLVPSIFAAWADDLVEMAALEPGQRVLDIACGTGIVARTAARRLGSGGNVTGLDLSAPMLAAARSAAAAAAEGATIEWREGSALQLPWAEEAFNVAFCQQGLQFFPDRPAATREMYRVLAPGGKLVLSVWREIERSPGFVVLAEALTKHISPDAGALLKSGPFSLSRAEEVRDLIADAGFKDISIRASAKVLRFQSSDEFVLRYAAGSALAGAVANVGDDARTALLAEVAERLQPYVQGQELAFPIESNIVVACR
jgi:ubiquinone/menaquinone biosynthesis C-methylase UbiE